MPPTREEQGMKYLVRSVLSSLSPATRDVIVGFGMAFDPAPRCHYKTFWTSDALAFYADGESLYTDWREVRDHRLPHSIAHYETHGGDHFWGFRSRSDERAKRAHAN